MLARPVISNADLQAAIADLASLAGLLVSQVGHIIAAWKCQGNGETLSQTVTPDRDLQIGSTVTQHQHSISERP